MSVLCRLSISHLRNITSAEINFASSFNVFYGDNGSGKSSILEAIYLLALAKSFRGTQQRPIIQTNQSSSTVFGLLDTGINLGVTKKLRGPTQIKVSNSTSTTASQLASLLPIQLINSDTFKILEGSPQKRRQFLDWGVFHVEHHFIDNWRKVQKAILNRNILLKNNASLNELEPWTRELATYGNKVDCLREKYFKLFLPVFFKVLKEFLPDIEFEISYYRGWNHEIDLLPILFDTLSRDLKYGYTVIGPQRADIKLKINGVNAIEILSRGQQKLLVSALKVSQGILLQQITKKQCIFLIDDLPSELDSNNRLKLCSILKELDAQVFITCVEATSLTNCFSEHEFTNNQNKLFHVKHGKINTISATLFN